jgi:predicted CoA-binding protein
MNASQAIQAFLAQPAVAIAGVSRTGRRFGNTALRVLKEKGYRVYPIHPSVSQVDGTTCYARFTDLPEHVGGVVIVVPPARAVDVIRDAAAAGIKHVWLQQGAESADVLRVCNECGIDAVSGECILMFAQPKGIHKAHQFVRRVLGTLPD